MTAKQKLWSERVSAWAASGKTSEAFSDGAEFTAMQLRHWASLLRKRAAKTNGAQEGIRIARVRRGRPKKSVCAVKPVAAAALTPVTLEIGPVRIVVQRGFDREALASVLELLRVGGHR